MEKVYKSKVDWWLGAILPLPFIGAGAAIVAGVVEGHTDVLWVGVGMGVLLALVFGGLVLPMRYVIGPDGLTVRAGLQRLVVPWERLIRVTPSGNPLSSPALSLKRLHVEYKKPNGKERWVLISPTDREQFVRDLAAASPRHEVKGDALVEKR